ncbi:uncharacterized protein KY384_005679 [Bacidia gigantensis]|uniref:uncharacterized protein n=1 Tax=Bacidia gigantensis TaxID=2732470 RepID=UPI001D03FC3E|nr:uncharacterized protein KY384_005679 [Bacidia gigantensis]KAG8529045.1 hypothetical protein KY384_005679 [Bacidia gigantensis]
MRGFNFVISILAASGAIALPCDVCSDLGTGDAGEVPVDITVGDDASGSGVDNSGAAKYSNQSTGGGASAIWQVGAKGTVKGVNLGGWLLLESWITPSLFPSGDYVDEYTFCQKNPNAQSQLEDHWEKFITESDFKQISDAGFNQVRIGVGYWSFQKLEGDPYITGAAEYLKKAVQWAAKYSLKVIIDLHGAPGSQNGFDNSGQFAQMGNWTKDGNIDHTLKVLKIISSKYGNNPAVSAIGLLNEPFPEKLGYKEYTTTKVVNYHNCGAKVVRKASSPNTAVTISDAFVNAFKWNDEYVQTGPGANIIDHHDYQVFDVNLLVLNLTAHLAQVTLDIDAAVTNSTHPTIIGEWSGALTDCAKYLNGRNEGARYEDKFSAGPGINMTCSEGENDFEKFKADQGLRGNVSEGVRAEE